MKIYALLTRQGTAAGETALCDEHMTTANMSAVRSQRGDDVLFDQPFIDCSENEYLQCVECGAQATDEYHCPKLGHVMHEGNCRTCYLEGEEP